MSNFLIKSQETITAGGNPIKRAIQLYPKDTSVTALQNRIAELEQQLQEQSYLIQINHIWANERNMDSSIKKTLQLVMKTTGSEAGCIFILDSEFSRLKTVEVSGYLPETLVDAFSKLQLLFNPSELRGVIEINSNHKIFRKFSKHDEKLLSFVVVPLIAGMTMIGYLVVMHRLEEQSHGHTSAFSQQDLFNLKIFAHNTALLLENSRMKMEQGKKELYYKIIETLISAIDAKDLYTQNHSRRVAALTAEFAKEIGLGKQIVETYRCGSLLHDIGKIGISDTILNKLEALTGEEFDIIKSHPIKGAKIIAPLDLDPDILYIVKHHHERYDGTGYPDGLKGEQIPLSARVVCIIDAWDAMTGKRAYRNQLSYIQAIDELKRGQGTQFDPSLVNEFIRFMNHRYTCYL